MKEQTYSQTPSRGKIRPEQSGPLAWVIHESRLPGLVAALLGLLLYIGTYGHQYAYDDEAVITNNWIVKRGLDAEGLKLIWTTEYRRGAWNAVGSLYRPIPLTMFAAEWQIAPNDPRLGHALNILLYALTGWMLWVVLVRVFRSRPPAMVAAAVLLFMAHPVHTEVVANIKSRDEILSLLFGLVTLYAVWRHLEERRWAWLLVAVFAYGLALFSKESAITLLAVIPLTIWFFHARAIVPIARVLGVLLVPALLFLYVRKTILDAQPFREVYSHMDSIYMAASSTMERLSTAFMMSARYIKTLVFPEPLLCDLSYPQIDLVGFDDPWALAGLLLLGGGLIWSLIGVARGHFGAYAVLFFLITFSLFSNLIIIIGTGYGERLLYLPSLGFTLFLAWGFSKWLGIDDPHRVKDPNGRGWTFWGAIGVVLMLYAGQTLSRNADWYDNYTLFHTDLLKSPNSAKLTHNVGVDFSKKSKDPASGALSDTTMAKRAIAMFDRSLELVPGMPMTHGARGEVWMDLGDEDRALADWKIALSKLPHMVTAQNGVGYILVKQGRVAEGEEHLRMAVQFHPRYVEAYRNLGIALVKQQRFQEAIEVWSKALEVEPDNLILMELIGMGHDELGDPERAKYWWDRVDRGGGLQ